MEIFQRKNAEKLRFGAVGALNTAVDFAILYGLTFIGFDKIASNYVSTTTAFLLSFTLNKNYTFQTRDANTKKQFLKFTIVTLSGLWLVQPFVMAVAISLLENLSIGEYFNLTVAKILATIVTLVWNYIFYSKVVFKK